MARTSRKLMLTALLGLVLLPSHNQARVLSETRVGYGDGDSASVVPAVSSATVDRVIESPPTSVPAAVVQPIPAKSFPVHIPLLESQSELTPELELHVRDELESDLLEELEIEKKQKPARDVIPVADDEDADLARASILGIVGIELGTETTATGPDEIEIADQSQLDGGAMNPAVSNEIDLIGREMSRIMQELSDGEKDPTKRLPIEPVIDAARGSGPKLTLGITNRLLAGSVWGPKGPDYCR